MDNEFVSAMLFMEEIQVTIAMKSFGNILISDAMRNVNVVHLYSATCVASEALLANHLCSAPSHGRLWQCRLGFEHDTLRLLPLPSHAGNCAGNPFGRPAQFDVFRVVSHSFVAVITINDDRCYVC